MNDELRDAIRKEIAEGIQKNVNGKLDKVQASIDAHNAKHELDMEELKPIIVAFNTTKTSGIAALWVAAAITTIGGALLVLRSLFFNH